MVLLREAGDFLEDSLPNIWSADFTSETVDDVPNTSTRPVEVLLIP